MAYSLRIEDSEIEWMNHIWGLFFREDIPAIAVVFNNGQWGAEKKNQVDFYSDRLGKSQKKSSHNGRAIKAYPSTPLELNGRWNVGTLEKKCFQKKFSFLFSLLARPFTPPPLPLMARP